MSPRNMLCTAQYIIFHFHWKDVLWFACLRVSLYSTLSKTHIWTARIWILQLHCLSRINDHMVHKQTAAGCSETGHYHQTEVLHVAAPLTSLSRMPWVRLPAEPHNKVWPAFFFFRAQTEYRVQPARQIFHSSTSFRHTRWPLSSCLKHIFQDKEKFLPPKNIQLMAPDVNEDFSKIFLAPFLPCILGMHNKLLRTTYIKCRKVCCTSYCSMLVNTLRFNSIV